MTEKTGVLVVDDSAFMRKILTQVIDRSSAFYVVDTARDGQQALVQLEKYGPEIQLVTLDIQMPKLDGLGCLKRIMAEHPRRVVMVSSLTTDGARETLEALENGAIDFLAKPGGAISLDFESVGDELIRILTDASHCALPRVLPATSRTPVEPVRPPQPAPAVEMPVRPAPQPAKAGVLIKGTQRLVVIASSTGGPKALAGFIPLLPRDTRAAMILVQHMPATFTRLLAERLNKASRITVKEAEDGEPLRRGICLVAPGGYHLEVTPDETVHLTKDPPIGGLRPCADITLHSVAAVFGSRAVGVVLTGMGHDGTEGCRALRKRGGKILVESKETALIYGMPRSIVENNLHDRIEPIQGLAQAVVETI